MGWGIRFPTFIVSLAIHIVAAGDRRLRRVPSRHYLSLSLSLSRSVSDSGDPDWQLSNNTAIEQLPHGVFILRNALDQAVRRWMVTEVLADEPSYVPHYIADNDPYRKPGQSGNGSLALLQWDYYSVPNVAANTYRSVRKADQLGVQALRFLDQHVPRATWSDLTDHDSSLFCPFESQMDSLLVLAYREYDQTDWHWDLAGKEGWVLTATIGGSSQLQYAKQVPDGSPAPPATEVHSTWMHNGDLALFHGGLLHHRVGDTKKGDDEWLSNVLDEHLALYKSETRLPQGVQRVNFQIRPWGCRSGNARRGSSDQLCWHARY